MYNKLNLSIEVNLEFLYKAHNKTIKWCLMWIMTFLKHGKLNRTNYLICTVLVILFFLVLNIIIDNNEFLWNFRFSYYINIIISSMLLLTLLSARLRYLGIKSPVTISLIITITVSFLYALSLLIFREWMVAGLIIHSASVLIAGIVLFILLIK